MRRMLACRTETAMRLPSGAKAGPAEPWGSFAESRRDPPPAGKTLSTKAPLKLGSET